MAISKVVYKSSANATPEVWMDATTATAAAADITAPKTAMLADGVMTTGTGSGGGGGGITPAPAKDVNFIDYDGTILYSYTAQEAQALSALPANPSHDRLTAQGWNWTLQQIKNQLTNVGGTVWVGQMYVTQSGATEIDVVFPDAARLDPILPIAVNGTITVDWGDNTTPDTVTAESLTPIQFVPHSYANTGSYMISISAVTGSYSLYGTSSYTLLHKNATVAQNRVYANCVRAVRIGTNITIGQYAFYYCTSLASITIPSTVTSIGNYAFYYCYSLPSITIPSTVTSIGDYAFSGCYTISNITIPSAVTSIGNYVFNNGYTISNITIPSTVTSIGNYAFSGCYSLPSITIPSAVTSIGNYAFSNCNGIGEYHLQSAIPPTLSNTALSGIVTDCIIFVPYSADHSILDAYKTTTNWSTYAARMQEEPA